MFMMAVRSRKLEVLFIVLVTMVPWNGPLEQRAPCTRDKAQLVRKLVNKRWVPVLSRFGVSMPLECPLHGIRDIFSKHEEAKIYNPPQWKCGFCGKSFYHEAHLDRHLENRHSDHLNNGEDSVCLADFCDIMRCEVLLDNMHDFDEALPSNTALDLWHQPAMLLTTPARHQERSQTGQQAVERALPRSLMRSTHPWHQWVTQKSSHLHPQEQQHSHSHSHHQHEPIIHQHHHMPVTAAPQGHSVTQDKMIPRESPPDDRNGDCAQEPGKCIGSSEETYNESGQVDGGPRELPLHPLHSWKDTCNEEHLAELRVKCQQLIQQCIGGLLLNLTMEQFKEVEGALSRVVCWYLTCERYWESGSMEPPEFPWALVTALVLLLTLGVSLAYYVVWVLCESQDQIVSTPVNNNSRERELPMQHQTRQRMSQTTESENECRDSGFAEGPLYPDGSDVSHVYSDYDAQSYRSRHYSEDSRLSGTTDDNNRAPRYYMAEDRMFNYATTFMPNYEHRRSRRNRYNYLDDYDNYHEQDQHDKYYDSSSLSREASDSFIYVSYPPEVKKRFTENR